MRLRTAAVVASFLCLVASSTARAGELSTSLKSRIASRSADEMITVWIELPKLEDAKQFKASIAASAPTRAERHAIAARRLKQRHASAQKNLLSKLYELQQRNLATNIKPHWLVNFVEADIRISELSRLSGHSDVEKVHAVPRILSLEPEAGKDYPAPTDPAEGIELNLSLINADSAWKYGYQGDGRVVCSFDTGVKGDHPALAASWKGLDGDSAAAWFDPRDREPFPHVLFGDHGTHTTGIMVGIDNITGDTIGVAPKAKWISAAVMDVDGASLIDGFEWAADPDGNPNTVDDVPDVINHSWGVDDIGCENFFYDLIEHTEALGIVNVFSAGNDGPNAASLRNPANRANDSLDCFAVGNIRFSVSPPEISWTSSRGPSDCIGGGIKPNVCAPGTGVRSAIANYPWYGLKSGTSMAAPHVSGLVALLRQKNPNATVDEVKNAILTTTQEFGMDLPDNDYGWGIIDCWAALQALSSNNTDPNVRVYAFDHPAIIPGSVVTGTIVLQNLGAEVTGVTGTLVATNEALTIIDGSATFGTIAEGDTLRAGDVVSVEVADTVSPGSILSLDFNISGNGGAYTTTRELSFVVPPRPERDFVTHAAGGVRFTISNYGALGLGSTSFWPAGGEGFRVDAGANDLYECGLMIGINSLYVSDGVRNAIGEPDGDFSVIPGGNLTLVSPGSMADEESSCRFSDARGESPMNLEITQNGFTFDNYSNNDFVILQYIVKNNNPTSISNLYVGMYMDWDIFSYSDNAGGYDAVNDVAWMAYNNGTTKSRYRGVRVLDGGLASVWTQTDSAIVYYSPYYPADGFTEAEKYAALAAGLGTATKYKESLKDLNQTISAGPLSLAASAVDTVAFAILAGIDSTAFKQAASFAAQAYDFVVTDVDEPGTPNLPEAFTLYPNYPNPFNPRTTIAFDLPTASEYTLSVYNALGQKVDEMSGRAGPGTVRVVWNAEDMASGVYLYKVTAGELSASRKMLLLK